MEPKREWTAQNNESRPCDWAITLLSFAVPGPFSTAGQCHPCQISRAMAKVARLQIRGRAKPALVRNARNSLETSSARNPSRKILMTQPVNALGCLLVQMPHWKLGKQPYLGPWHSGEFYFHFSVRGYQPSCVR